MKIYTKTGDDGETGLFAGPRVAKDHPRIEAYGTVDELNAMLGMIRADPLPPGFDPLLQQIQNDLFNLGAELATPDPQAKGTMLLSEASITDLEQAIDAWEANLSPLRNFILPGGSRAAAGLHIARTIARRAERQTVTLANTPGERIDRRVVVYLNRLSDFFFVAARAANAALGVEDVAWQKPQ